MSGIANTFKTTSDLKHFKAFDDQKIVMTKKKVKFALKGVAVKHSHLEFRKIVNRQCRSKPAIYYKSIENDLIIESNIIHYYSTMNSHLINIHRKIQ